MTPVGKALWYIESHFAEEVALDDVAACGGVSRFHLSRAFGVATGHSIMRYVRGGRLTEAARRLADGAPDILSVALDAGYGSHEAFTRAFRDPFGVTPETAREQRHRREHRGPVQAGRRSRQRSMVTATESSTGNPNSRVRPAATGAPRRFVHMMTMASGLAFATRRQSSATRSGSTFA